MSVLTLVKNVMSKKERVAFFVSLIVLVVSLFVAGVFTLKENSAYVPVRGGSYSEGIVGQPIMVNPILSKNQPDLDISALVYSPLSKLISSLEKNDDERTYTIKLKEDLLWDDGKPLTSDDVVFTIKTIQDPESLSPLEKNWRGISVKRESELKIVFSLPTAYSFFKITIKHTPIIPAHIFSAIPVENFRLSSYSLKPVGSGPYKIKKISQRRDGFITKYQLVPNDLYSGKAPFISNFFFKFYESKNDLIKSFKRREINGFGSLSPINGNLSAISNIKVNSIPMSRYYAIFINPINNPDLKNKYVREALDLSINKTALVKLVGKNDILPINSPFVVLNKDIKNFQNKYNTESARTLLEKSKESNIEISLIVPDTTVFKNIGNFIKKSWTGIGIERVTITPVNPEIMFEDVIKTRNYEVMLFGNVLENPLDLFPFWHSSQQLSPGLNLSFYKNLKVDKLIEEIHQTEDKNKRVELMRDASSIIEKDVPAIFLFTMPYLYVHSKKLEGMNVPYLFNPSNRFLDVESWSVVRARAIK